MEFHVLCRTWPKRRKEIDMLRRAFLWDGISHLSSGFLMCLSLFLLPKHVAKTPTMQVNEEPSLRRFKVFLRIVRPRWSKMPDLNKPLPPHYAAILGGR